MDRHELENSMTENHEAGVPITPGSHERRPHVLSAHPVDRQPSGIDPFHLYTQEPFDFQRRDDEELNIREAVGQAIGAASVAWNPRPLGLFDDQFASSITEALLNEIGDYTQKAIEYEQGLDRKPQVEEATISHSDARFREMALSLAAPIGGHQTLQLAQRFLAFLTGTDKMVQIEGSSFTIEQAESIEDYVQARIWKYLEERGLPVDQKPFAEGEGLFQ